MRVLTFLHSFEPGGVERIALRLMHAWLKAGVDARLFMGRSDGALRAEFAEGLPHTAPRRPPFSIAWMETLWMILTLPKTIRQTKPDVLFCAGNSYTIVALAMKLRFGRRCPPIVAKISNDLERKDIPQPFRSLYHRWVRSHARFIDHFVGMDDPMQQEITEAVPLAPGRITIIPDPALDDRLIDTLRAPTGQCTAPIKGIRFVAVSRLAGQKNLSLMLSAFALGAAPEDRLTIFGDGPERDALIKLRHRLGLESRVLFAGHIVAPVLELPKHDVLLLSSNYEGVPAVILEALAAGIPVITTRSSRSVPSLIRNGQLGAMVEPGDVDAFAYAIQHAGGMRQDLDQSLKQARRFTIERASRSYLRCFEASARPSPND
ncbi:MAG: glycosyltransferase [Novosphingobium sp.]|nr:glycosyltransferase [Novosphingobium sp.]